MKKRIPLMFAMSVVAGEVLSCGPVEPMPNGSGGGSVTGGGLASGGSSGGGSSGGGSYGGGSYGGGSYGGGSYGGGSFGGGSFGGGSFGGGSYGGGGSENPCAVVCPDGGTWHSFDAGDGDGGDGYCFC